MEAPHVNLPTFRPHEDRLAGLLLDWEELFELGQDKSAEELCWNCPELKDALAERIAKLKLMNWVKKSRPLTGNQRPAGKELKEPEIPKKNPKIRREPGTEPIPGYRLLRLMGVGAFGEVWAAETFGKRVAVKFFHGHLDAPDANRRAQIELEGLARIKKITHPAILEVYSQEVRENTLILVTELADASLESVFRGLRKYPIWYRIKHALDLLGVVATVLDHLQEDYDLMHLDIKPANLLLLRGSCKIGDFGTVFQLHSNHFRHSRLELSFPSESDPAEIKTILYRGGNVIPWNHSLLRNGTLYTSHGAFTPYYAPPEAFQGRISRSFDQYSLALTFCELVTGQIPFVGEGDRQLTDRRLGRVNMASLFFFGPLTQAIKKALSSDHSNRFSSCRRFIRSLRDAWAGVNFDEKDFKKVIADFYQSFRHNPEKRSE
jgi:eukaryotic-like serine/threonine-protein kinase